MASLLALNDVLHGMACRMQTDACDQVDDLRRQIRMQALAARTQSEEAERHKATLAAGEKALEQAHSRLAQAVPRAELAAVKAELSVVRQELEAARDETRVISKARAALQETGARLWEENESLRLQLEVP